MLELLLARLDHNTQKQIVKCIAYGFYQNPPLSDEQFNFTKRLVSLLEVSDEEEDEIYTIDIRSKHSISDFAKQFRDSKALLFFLVITANVFEDKIFTKFTQEKLIKNLSLDKNNKTKIINLAKKYIRVSDKIYYFLYRDKKSKFKFRRNSDRDANFLRIFLVESEQVDKVSRKEKIAFIKMLHYMMLDDARIDTTEQEILKRIAQIFDLSIRKSLTVNEGYKGPHIDDCKIETEWFKRFLLFIFLFSRVSGDFDINQERFRSVAKFYDLPEKDLNSFAENMGEYNLLFSEIVDTIRSGVISRSPGEVGAEITQRTINVLEGTADIFINTTPFGWAARLLKILEKDQEISRNSRDKEVQFGLSDVKEVRSSNCLLICVSGFRSDVDARFGKWKESLEKIGYQGNILGLNWKASSDMEVLTKGPISWPEALTNTKKASIQLFNDIKIILRCSPHMQIILMGHSLGARIIHRTLIDIHEYNKKRTKNFKIYDVFLFAGAVERDIDQTWNAALTSVENKLYNFYSANDSALFHFYQRAHDEPIGLHPIVTEKYLDEDFKYAELMNLNVTDIIKEDHGGYLDKITQLIECQDDSFNVIV